MRNATDRPLRTRPVTTATFELSVVCANVCISCLHPLVERAEG
jgi:hypothetical protein